MAWPVAGHDLDLDLPEVSPRGQGRKRKRKVTKKTEVASSRKDLKEQQKEVGTKKICKKKRGKKKRMGSSWKVVKRIKCERFWIFEHYVFEICLAQVIKGVGGVEFMAALGDVSYRWQHLILRCRCCKYERGLSSEPLG